MDIIRTIKEYYAQLNVHKFDNLDKMDQFFATPNLPKLTQEEVDNMNMPISIKYIESPINNLPKQKIPGPDGFTGQFY